MCARLRPLFLVIYQVVDWIRGINRLYDDEKRRENADKLMESLESNSFYIPEMREAIYENYLSGHNFPVSALLAKQEFGEDDAE